MNNLKIPLYLSSLDGSLLNQLHSLDGKVDLFIGLSCIFLAYVFSELIIKKVLNNKFNLIERKNSYLFYYLWARSIFPLTAIVLCSINYARFLIMTDKHSLVYPALIWLLLLMLIIRIIVGSITFVIPRGPIKFTLGHTISLTLWVIFLLWWSGIGETIFGILSAIKFSIGHFHLSVLSILYAVLTVLIIIIVSLWINSFLERWVRTFRKVDGNFQQVILRISRFVIFILIILSVLPVLGVDLTTLSVFSGALGVGIGIGLQKLVSNFISGIMLLVDHSVKVGDRLVVGEYTGYVTKITSRHVVLQSLDNSEILVPNDKFMVDSIINQSYTDTALRLTFNIGVAYATDVRLALELLIQATAGIIHLDPQRPPATLIDKFGAYSIDLCLYVWLQDPRESLSATKTQIHLNILDAFAKHKIEIPYPRYDLSLENFGNNPPKN